MRENVPSLYRSQLLLEKSDLRKMRKLYLLDNTTHTSVPPQEDP